MTPTEELKLERAALRRADQDISSGEQRLHEQVSRSCALTAAGHDNRESVRLARLLDATLTQWRIHRDLIQQRIAYLESRLRRA